MKFVLSSLAVPQSKKKWIIEILKKGEANVTCSEVQNVRSTTRTTQDAPAEPGTRVQPSHCGDSKGTAEKPRISQSLLSGCLIPTRNRSQEEHLPAPDGTARAEQLRWWHSARHGPPAMGTKEFALQERGHTCQSLRTKVFPGFSGF